MRRMKGGMALGIAALAACLVTGAAPAARRAPRIEVPLALVGTARPAALRVGDRIEFRVARSVPGEDGRVLIMAGTPAYGRVTEARVWSPAPLVTARRLEIAFERTESARGETVTLAGRIRTDRHLGDGYRCTALVESVE